MGNFRISDFTDDSKPREKLLNNGPVGLSDAELLAIILRSGLPGQNVVEMANGILKENGGLNGLRRLSKEELLDVKGIGSAKAAEILATIELGRRFSKAMVSNGERPRINCPDDIYQYVHYQMEHLDHEELLILCLDTKHYVIGEDNLYTGTVNSSNIRVAEIFQKPLLLKAASFALVHNHPSGDPTPSAADIVVTRNIMQAGKTLDLPLLDHIIIGAGTFSSVKSYLE